jgi:hypothetical protein
MTEKQLISAGFKKEEVSAEEAGTDKGYYFYSITIGDVDLISNPNDQLVNGAWACYFLNSDEIEIIYAHYLQMIISALKQSVKNVQNQGSI